MRQTGTGQEFVVHLDRRAVDRLYTTLIGIWVVLALVGLIGFLVLTSRADAGPAAFAPLVFLFVCLPNIGIYAWTWRATRSLAEPLVLSRSGLTFETPRGRVALPWAAIRALTVTRVLGRPQLTALLHPAAGPGAPGITATLSNGGWRTIQRSGLRLAFRVVQEQPAEVLGAIANLSGGRFAPAPPS